MLLVTFQNDATGLGDIANYEYRVYINKRLLDIGRIENHPRSSGWRRLLSIVSKRKDDATPEHHDALLRGEQKDTLLAHLRRNFATPAEGWANLPTLIVSRVLDERPAYWRSIALGAWDRVASLADRDAMARDLVAQFMIEKLQRPEIQEGTMPMFTHLLDAALQEVDWLELADAYLDGIEGYRGQR